MLKDLIPKIRAFLIGSVILAVSAGVAVVAAGFGLYAVLIQLQLTVPEAAGVTAVVFAVVAAICSLLLRSVFSPAGGRERPPKAGPAVSPEAMQMGMEAGAAVIGLITDLLASRRIDQRERAKRQKAKSRRAR
jgi:membrane associated rhomboid family serine protease